MDDNNRILPTDPLEFIKKCIRHGQIFWTYHVNMRMSERTISRNMILDSLSNFEIIEEYPDDKYLPSYLVYTKYEDLVLHILFAVDVEGNNVRIITAYYPDPSEWNITFKKRRRP